MSDPFTKSNDAAKRAADKAARDAAAKQIGHDTKAKPTNPNDDLGYRYVNQGQGWPWPKL